jgi:hypothetical protein
MVHHSAQNRGAVHELRSIATDVPSEEGYEAEKV